MSVSLTMVKDRIDAVLKDILPVEADYIVVNSFIHDHIRPWYRIGHGVHCNNVLLTRHEIEDNPDYVAIAVDRVSAFLGIPLVERRLEPEIPIDPIFKDIMEGRGLQDFMEDT